VRTEAIPRPISEAIWADRYLCAMLLSFATSSSVQRRRIWVLFLNKCRLLKIGTVEKFCNAEALRRLEEINLGRCGIGGERFPARV
jgi:hypothetical protein